MSKNIYINNQQATIAEQSEIATLQAQIDNLAPTHAHFKRTFEVYAHQGFSGSVHHNAASNTLASLNEARMAGCDGVETDMRKTADGVWVIAHDASVSGTVNGVATTMVIAETTLATLKTLAIGTSDYYGDMYVPTVKELCQRAAYQGMKLLLEYKVTGANLGMEEVAGIVLETGMQGRVTYMSSPQYWAQISAVDRNANFAEVIFDFGSITDFTDYVTHLNGVNTVSIDYWAKYADTETIDMTNVSLAQQAGLSINYWNIVPTACVKYFDSNPIRVTVNSEEIFSSIETYLASKEPDYV